MKTAKALQRIAAMRKNLTVLNRELNAQLSPQSPPMLKKVGRWIKCADQDLAAAASVQVEDSK